MSEETGITRVLDAWKLVGTDLAQLGRRAFEGATGAAGDAAAGGASKPAAAARGALGELGTGLTEDNRAQVIGREIEAAVKVSLDELGTALTRLSERLRSMDEA